jgi:hypothetical protein
MREAPHGRARRERRAYAPQPQASSLPPRRQASGSPLPALLLIAKFAWPLIPLAFYAVGGNDTPAPAVLTASDRRQAEELLMGRMITAAPEMERRLARWLRGHDGLLFVRERDDGIDAYGALHVLPALTPWRASCGPLGLTVTIGRFEKEITEIALDERQCDELLSVLGRTMRSLTATDDRPAPQPRKDTP